LLLPPVGAGLGPTSPSARLNDVPKHSYCISGGSAAERGRAEGKASGKRGSKCCRLQQQANISASFPALQLCILQPSKISPEVSTDARAHVSPAVWTARALPGRRAAQAARRGWVRVPARLSADGARFAIPQSTRGTPVATLLRDPYILIAAGKGGRQHVPRSSLGTSVS